MENTHLPPNQMHSDQSAASSPKALSIPLVVMGLALTSIITGVASYYAGFQKGMTSQLPVDPTPKTVSVSPSPSPATEGDGVMCTADAKICPDGSAVGRRGPNCEFAPCPEAKKGVQKNSDETLSWQTYSSKEYGFSLKYPTDWEVRDLMPANAHDFPTKKFWIGYGPKKVKQDVYGMVQVTSMSLREKIDEFKQVYGNSSVAKVLPEEKPIKIGDVDAIEMKVVNPSANYESTHWFFMHKGYSFEVTGNSTDSETIAKVSKTFTLTK